MIVFGICPLSSIACLLLVVLANLFFHYLPSSHASQFPPSSPLPPSSFFPSLCNPREHSLFLADSSDRQAFFQCRPFAELPSIGLWERHFCPNGMHFAYATQQCSANSLPYEAIRDRNELFRIAILNGSCASGERCIGGTVCDQTEGRCLCPQGTVAVLENLYCATIPRETYHSYGIQNQCEKQWPNQREKQWQNQQAALFTTVPPGSDCSRGQLCGGGSVCVPSLGICVCPQGMEDNGGQCVGKSAPKRAEFRRNGGQNSKKFVGSQAKLSKALLGQWCNEQVGEYCADQSAHCEEGLCRCVVPMVEQNGKCQRMMLKEEAGVGKQCKEGQICERGTSKGRKTAAEEEEAERRTTDTGTEAKAAPAMVSISSAEGNSSPSPKASRKKPKGEASVGEKCSLNADCLNGAYCNGNTQPPTCQCLSTHVNVKDRCEKVIFPGQRGCETDLQCSTAYAGTRCIGRQCVCPPGSTPIDGSCIPAIAWPGERCNITQLMPVCSADSYCFGGRCVCNPPLHLFQKQCINRQEGIPSLDKKTEESDRKKNVKSEESDRKRNAKNEKSDRKRNVKSEESDRNWANFNAGGGERTTEMSGMEQIFSTLALLKSATFDGPTAGRRGTFFLRNEAAEESDTDEAMDGGRQRRESSTDAFSDWTNTAGLSHNHRLEGEPCSPEDFCLDGAVCVDGHCRCVAHSPCKRVPTFRSIGSQCIERVDRCVGGSVCRNSTCICSDDSLPNVDKTHCRQSPGGRCSDGQKCSGQSECRLGTCQCRAGMRMASQGDQKRRKYCQNGEKCTGKGTCGPERQKDNGQKGKLMDEVRRDDDGAERNEAAKGQRRKKAQPGESCAGDELCTGGSFCSEKSICICAPGERVQMGGGEAKHCALELGETARDSGQPVKVEPGQLCVEGGMECAGGAKCQNGICTCAEGHTLFRHECLPPRALPISVEKMHTQSALFSPAIMDSPSSIGSDYESNLQEDPIPSKTVSPGAMCRLPLECPYRTECLRGVCRCQRGETIVNGMCRKTIHEVSPGGRCDTQKGLDCVGESHCFYGICVCLYGLVNVGNECANVKVLERVGPGKRCVPGQHCVGKAKCVKSKCQCAKGHKIDMALRRCVKVATPRAVTTQLLAYPSEAEVVVARPAPIVEIPLGSGSAILENNGGGGQRPTKFIYAIPAALAAAAEEGKFQQILTANQMSINLLDQDMRSMISKLIDQQKQSSETAPKMTDNCGGESGPTNCQQNQRKPFQLFAPNASPISRTTDQRPFQSVPASASSLQNNNLQSVTESPAPLSPVPASASSPPLLSKLPPFNSPPHLQGQPGYFCAADYVCHGGAICLAGLCICRPGFRPIDGFCQISKVNLGEQCFLDEQCKENGFCIGGYCHCRAQFGAIHSAFLRNVFHRRRCPARPVAAVGEDCSKAQACGWNSICGTFSGVCECAIGMENEKGACVAAGRPRGTECLSSSNCHKFAFCDNGLCSCKVGFERIDGFCLPPARPVVEDPKAYIDPETMVMLLNKKGNKFESEKADSTQFGPNKWMSASGLFQAVHPPMSSGDYLPTEPIELRMDDSLPLEDNAWKPFASQHSTLFDDSNDVDRQIARHFGIGNFQKRRFASTERNLLLRNAQQHQRQMHLLPRIHSSVQYFPVRSNERTEGTEAKEKGGGKAARKSAKGQQSERKAKERQQKEEQKIAMPGEYCGTRQKQCVGNSICLKGWCQCAEGAHVGSGGTCANVPRNSLLPPSSASSSESLPHRPHRPFDSCFSNRPCIHGASCVRSAALLFVQKLGPFCQCHPGLIFQHNQCIPRRPELKAAKPGERCHPPSVICDFGSICGEENICKCPAHRKLISGLCVHLALPGESCAKGEFCADGAICAPGLSACVCQVGWTVRNGKCRKGKTLRKLTTRARGTRRGDRGSQAGGRQSAERAATQSHPATLVPKLLLMLGQTCQFDSDCAHLSNTHCAPDTRQCACRDGFFQLYSSACVPKERIKRPGEQCISSAHLCAEQSWCKNGRCACIQRDSHVVEGHCVRKLSKKWTIRRHPPRGQSKALDCSMDEHCFGGAICTEKSKCECKGANGERNQTRSNEGQCATEADCPRGMRCREGQCFCSDEVGRRGKLVLKMSMQSESDQEKEKREKRKERVGVGDEEGGEDEDALDLEWDYAVEGPVFGAVAEQKHQKTRHRPQQQRNAVPILPGTFCDAFSRCGEGAECFFGKCQCIFREHRLAFVNGVTKCLGKEEETKARRRKRDGPSNVNCTNCAAPPNKSVPSEFRRKHFHQKSSKGSKIFMPGELCGPLDNCAGGSSCVEGFCLCPAGTRPSPASGNCESFAQQHKMATAERGGQSGELLNETEQNKGTAPPTPITEWKINPTSTNSTLTSLLTAEAPRNVPTAEHPRLSPPLTDVLFLQVPTNGNFSGSETRMQKPLSPVAERGKEFGRVTSNVMINATEKNATGRAYARPSEGCSRAEICTGGSICNQSSGVCECPAAKPILRNHICTPPNEQPMVEAKTEKPSKLCNSSDTKCVGNSICAEVTCRCQRGLRHEDVHCINGQDDTSNKQTSSQKSGLGVLPPAQLSLLNEEVQQQQLSTYPSQKRIRMHAKPRISGPPLRRLSSSLSPLLAPAGTRGVCPPGNAPLTDQTTGLIIQCNGMTPNCPPKSYCFVTGVASEVYNCCKFNEKFLNKSPTKMLGAQTVAPNC